MVLCSISHLYIGPYKFQHHVQHIARSTLELFVYLLVCQAKNAAKSAREAARATRGTPQLGEVEHALGVAAILAQPTPPPPPGGLHVRLACFSMCQVIN